MEYKTKDFKIKFFIIFSTLILLFCMLSVTIGEVNSATLTNDTNQKAITNKTFDWDWEYEDVVKKEGKYYKKYVKDVETCYYEYDENSYDNLKYLYSKHKKQTKLEELYAEKFEYGWNVDDKYKYKGKAYIEYINEIDVDLYDDKGWFSYDYEVKCKTVSFNLPKKYVAYFTDLTKNTKKLIKKNGKTSIGPDKYWNGKKIHSGVLIIIYQYKGKEYTKKIQVKAGKKKYLLIPKKAIIKDSIGILIAKGKKIKVRDVFAYLKG
ncbi:hypothetical protein SDC9_46162 [bioreactor metagenome]|uniref:Uncharacterized protein n=1 Tax=bioreactor metagenome TaxID=1076179 RepID=A0A644W8Y7_9ZZZZ|nr:hypothetical protein [Methanobrevibacter sp.]MEA4957823.1 hypothetical protein [Methanobrevibacter sp.]